MKLLIHGRNLEVTPAIRDYTEEKLKRAIGHFDGMVKEADVHLSVARNPRVPQQTAEVTVFANGTVIRAQERSENLYASIDLVAGKLTRQLRRYKDEEDKKGPIFWTGPVLAGGQLWVASSRGEVWKVSAGEGSAQFFADLGQPVSLAPVVAEGHLYILDDSGKVHAWR